MKSVCKCFLLVAALAGFSAARAERPPIEKTGDAGSPYRIFCGDDRTAYRDPAALYAGGKFHLFFTLVETEPDGLVHSYVATSRSSDLRTWSAPLKLTPRSDRDYSSPGNVVRDGDEWVLCFQSYPRPGNRDDGKVRYGDETARLYTMRSRDLVKWTDPELLRVKGPEVCEKDMGRMIDPYLLRGADGRWWCFYKQNGASMSRSSDLRNWEYVGRTEAGENVCVVPSDGGYVMLHSPANGIAMKRSSDLVHWKDVPGLITLGQGKWEWAKGRLTAGFLLDARSVAGIGKFVLFFHGSGPRTELEGDFDRNASIGLAVADRIEGFFRLPRQDGSVKGSPVSSLAVPIPESGQNPRWAGPGYWSRRHAAILREIAAGPKRYDCVFVGDSITHNWIGWSERVDLDVAERLFATGGLKFPVGPGRRVWRELGEKYRLLNLGLAGDTTANVHWRLRNGELEGYRARFFMVMIGTNDGGDAEGVVEGVKGVLDEIRRHHPESRILLSPIFPSGETPEYPRHIRNMAANRRLQGLADGHAVIWCDFNGRLADSRGQVSPVLMPDFLHPLEEGYRIWRDAVEPYLREPDDPMRSAAYFWMWNGRLDPDALVGQLEEMHAKGLRNVCIHPFPKDFRPETCPSAMEPGYLSDGYFRAYEKVVRRAGELGMHAWLYDEGGWPSIKACGQVAASDPEGRFRPRFYGFRGDGSFGLVCAPYGNPSIVEKGATERFIALTHERYAKAMPALIGNPLRVAFTDEPDRPRGQPGASLGWTADFADVFKARKGYDLVPHVKEMLERAAETDDRLAKLRIDYEDVMADLVVERYFNPIRSWCAAHGMLSGGHVNGEDEPEAAEGRGHGHLLRTLRALDVPGVDAIWRQLFPSKDPSVCAKPFPRYASSVAHQEGRPYALSESFGIYGDSTSPEEIKWTVDTQLVRGINTFVFGYYNQSNARHWMLLFEPHSGPVAPYWEMEGQLFDYVAERCRTLSRGRPGAETAVYFDQRGFWAGGRDREEAGRAHYAAAAALDRSCCDYDFVDDEALSAALVGTNGTLRIGAMTYGTLVLPTAKWMTDGAKCTVDRFRETGGRVVGPDGLAAVPRTLAVSGCGADGLRALRRVDGAEEIHFVHNEPLQEAEVEIVFPNSGRCVRRTFAAGESVIFINGVEQGARPAWPSGATVELAEGWSLRKLVSHEVGADDFVIRPCEDRAVSVKLGDWRGVLGETFSGKAVYRTVFSVSKAGPARLDLGTVRWCAGVRLNGRDLGGRFFGPFVWDVDLAAGENVLEVTVANLLSTHLGSPTVRGPLAAKYPPCDYYEPYQGEFDRLNRESGLFGPVRLMTLHLQ